VFSDLCGRVHRTELIKLGQPVYVFPLIYLAIHYLQDILNITHDWHIH